MTSKYVWLANRREKKKFQMFQKLSKERGQEEVGS